ncbi:A24 family peptidase [Stenotrophomonas aracearum]|jgi:prepilin peptidase CpaA|uniref:A24 family peptidase n=1 Tax=Stenotrophomonas aracearum TaxID=3003272 RepID=A0ABY9Y912_9GAMM|nr:A24 family peptidase [Stenotrophomonas sp. A5588]WNH47190.1 A24 family peptidase [Stenotrophomonas sp. A5588]
MSLLPLLALLLSVRIAISDLYARRVPNTWLAATALAALAWLLGTRLAGTPLPLLPHVAGAALGLAALLPFYAIGWMGAGDVKYFAVLGLMLGMGALWPLWLLGSLLAAAHAVALLLGRRFGGTLPLRLQLLRDRAGQHWKRHPLARGMQAARQGRVGIPFAAYLAVATVSLVLWQGENA